MYGFLATLVVLTHFAFVLFVMFGGLLVTRWPKVVWVHVPLACWGGYVEFSGAVCPLTPLENRLRRMAGERGYTGDFLDEHLVRLLYPPGLTREMQIVLGAGAILLNVAVYVWVVGRRRRRPGVDRNG